MKKQYTLLVIISFCMTNILATPTKEDENNKKLFDDIDWNSQKTFDKVVAAEVPTLEKSLLGSFSPYSYSSTIEKITPLTLEQLDSNKVPDYRRKVSRAIIEMIQEINGHMEQHKDTVAILLKTVHPKMMQFKDFALKADKLKLLDEKLQEQVPAWIMKYDGYITEYDKQNLTAAENYRKDIVATWKEFGFTNACDRALYTLRNLDPLALKKNGPAIQAKTNDFLATLVHQLNNSKTESTELVLNIYDVLELSHTKGIILDRSQLDTTKKVLRDHQTDVIAPALKDKIERQLKAAKAIKSTEIMARTISDDTYKKSITDGNASDDEYNITDFDTSTWVNLTAHLLKKVSKKPEPQEK